MSSTTIATLLEELREVDFDAWKDIRFLLANTMMFPEPRNIPLEQHIWHHGHGPEMGYVATVNHGNIIKGETSAAAILVAYIEAKRASK